MPIHSYLVYPRRGNREKLISELNELSQCEVVESTNEDMLILVTDTPDEYQEGALQEALKSVPHLEAMALVYGQEG